MQCIGHVHISALDAVRLNDYTVCKKLLTLQIRLM